MCTLSDYNPLAQQASSHSLPNSPPFYPLPPHRPRTTISSRYVLFIYHWRELPQVKFLSRPSFGVLTKFWQSFVATNTCLSRQNKSFVTTKMIIVAVYTRLLHVFVATKMILVSDVDKLDGMVDDSSMSWPYVLV